MYVWINETLVRYSEDSKTPAEFNISSYLRPGENSLVVEVYKWSDSSYLEDQDFWRMGGITRDVFLMAREPGHIKDFRVQAGLDETYSDGIFILEIEMSDEDNIASEWSVQIKLIDDTDSEIFNIEKDVEIIDGVGLTELTQTVKNVRLWSAELPNLYKMLILLKDETGEVVEVVKQDVGFRTVEIKESTLRINGEYVYFTCCLLKVLKNQHGMTSRYCRSTGSCHTPQ